MQAGRRHSQFRAEEKKKRCRRGAGALYFSGEAGQVSVVKAGREFEVLATNELGETCMATPAISDGTLFFRAQPRDRDQEVNERRRITGTNESSCSPGSDVDPLRVVE